MRLTKRAIYFHQFMKKHGSSNKYSLQGKEVVPLEAGIHLESDKANKPRPIEEVKQ